MKNLLNNNIINKEVKMKKNTKNIDDKNQTMKKKKSAKITDDQTNKVSQINAIPDNDTLYLEDIIGQENAISELKQFLLILSRKEIFDQWRIKLPKGFLFVGEPGTGKTATVQALKKSSHGLIEVMELQFSNFANRYVNATLEMINGFIEDAIEESKQKHVVIFIDEIDSMIPLREANQLEQTRERVNAFLTWMDGNNSKLKNITFIGATNNVDLVDPAALRPGRFDKVIKFNTLDARSLTKCLSVHLMKKNLNKNQIGVIDWDEVSDCFGNRQNAGASIPEIVNLILRKKANEHLSFKDSYQCLPKIDTQSIIDGVKEFFIDRNAVDYNYCIKNVVGF